MKIKFNRQEISNKIAPLMSVVSNNNTFKEVEGILIEANEPGNCSMTTFDLEKGVKVSVDLEIIEPGSCIINAQKFNKTLQVMNDDEIILTVDENLKAVFECGKSSHNTGAYDAKKYPELPDLTSEKGFIISQADFKKMLSKVSYAMGVNEPRPMLNGCYIRTEEGQINVVACDGFKLAVCSAETNLTQIENSTKGATFSFIVPVKSVNELVRLLSDDEEETITVYMSHKNMVIVFDGLIFFTKLILGEYLDYNRIIVKNHRISVTMDKSDIIAALEKAAVVTEEKIAGSVKAHVKLEISGELFKVSAVSSASSIYDEFEVEHEGDDMTIAFNNRFLLDSIRACRADRIKISLSSSFNPINIEPCDDEGGSELFTLLPVRTRE